MSTAVQDRLRPYWPYVALGATCIAVIASLAFVDLRCAAAKRSKRADEMATKLYLLRDSFDKACESYRNVSLAMQRLLVETHDDRIQRTAGRELRYFSDWMYACGERVWYCRTSGEGECERVEEACIRGGDRPEPCSKHSEVYTFSTEAKNRAFRDLPACEAARAAAAQTMRVSTCDAIGEDLVP